MSCRDSTVSSVAREKTALRRAYRLRTRAGVRGEKIMSSAHPPLDDLLTGRISADDRRRIEEHLAGCPICRAEWERLTAARELLRRSSEAEPVPDHVAAAVSSALRGASGPVVFARRIAIGIAAVAAVLIAVLLLRKPTEDPTTGAVYDLQSVNSG